jgi:hypothetical protein
VVRTDRGGIIDCVGNYGADGIVGPHFEKEGSYYTIKEIWSPVQVSWPALPIDAANGSITLRVTNRYDFLNLNSCRFGYRYLRLPEAGQTQQQVVGQGTLAAPNVAPGEETTMVLKNIPATANAVELTVTDATGHEVVLQCKELQVRTTAQTATSNGSARATCRQQAQGAVVESAGRSYAFDGTTGWLTQATVDGQVMSLGKGPRFVAARRSDRSFDQFYNHDDKEAEKKKTTYTLYADQGSFDSFAWDEASQTLTVKYRYGTLDAVTWHFLPSGDVDVQAAYHFTGVVDLMGVAFDYPEEKVKSKTWVGNGPYRVWQNRLDGPEYGLWQNDYNDPVPGESWNYPEFKGYFSNVNWMQINTAEGGIVLSHLAMDSGADRMAATAGPRPYVGVYQPRDGRDQLLYDLPHTGLSVLQVIPAVRNKVNTTDLNGPSAQPAWAVGAKSLSFRLRLLAPSATTNGRAAR